MRYVRIEPDTAKYYLRLESLFESWARESRIDLDIFIPGYTANQRYEHRSKLHDAWEAVVAKREFKPRGNAGQTRRPNRRANHSGNAPNF